MIWLETVGYALLVTATMATVDFAHAKYALAMFEHRRSGVSIHAAARWSVVQWSAASIGFVVAVKVSMWFLPFEAAGLYIGSVLGGTQAPPSGVTKA